MNNIPQKSESDYIKTSVDPKTGKIITNASGPNAAQNHKKAFWRSVLGGIAIMAVGASLGILLYRDKEKADTKSTITKDNNKTDNKIRKNHEAAKDAINVDTAKTQNDIELHHERTANNIDFDNARTDNLLRLEEARSEREQSKTIEFQQRCMDRLKEKRLTTEELVNRKTQLSRIHPSKQEQLTFNPAHPYAKGGFLSFYDYFNSTRGWSMPNLPPLLSTVIDEHFPYGFNVPAFFTCLSVLGAYCFSSLRADFHGATQTPTIFVIIEGSSGSGKGVFNRLYNMLAERFIEHDNKWLNIQNRSANYKIIQTLSVKITRAKYAERQYGNQDVFTFMFCAEIDSVKKLFRENGLGDDFIRLDFDNGLFESDNCRKDVQHGYRPIYNNFVFTGTPQTIASFIEGKVENGDAPRIIWADIPEAEFDDSRFTMPDDDTKKTILDELDRLQEQYSYRRNEDGNEFRCPDTHMNLTYVQIALDEWSSKQKSMYEKDCQKARPEQYRRISTIAFRCAMVLHALWGFPQDEETRQKVVVLTQYIADYVMERYIYKFGHFHNAKEQPHQVVSKRGVYKEIPENVIADWVMRNRVIGSDGKPVEGYGTFAREWNTAHPGLHIAKDTVKRRMAAYRNNHPDE